MSHRVFLGRSYNEGNFMKPLIKKMLLLISLTSASLLAASDFIITPNKKTHISGSRNTLKEKLGQSAKQAINFTTELGSLMGRVKIGFADSAEKLCKIDQLSQMQKNDGHIQIHLSSIQSCFTDLVENLIDNKGFFKKASRGDLSGLVGQINDICKSLQDQVTKFEQLGGSAEKSDQTKEHSSLVIAQFDSSAKDLNDLQEKVKGLKCLKKS
jgi:hypothetical protein